jgi:fructan beta-fructosidase
MAAMIKDHAEQVRPGRPRFHLAASSGWLNDPNGLVYLDGEYHLFFQHYPDEPVPGPMHWGHAVSTDLLEWRELPVALRPDADGPIWSGSAVIDVDDSSGFGRGCLVLAYTHATRTGQHQCLAWSTDRGRTVTPYAGNPVLACPPGIRDFRDPKVLRYRGPDGSWWVMVLVAGDHARFYVSDDLKDWRLTSTFEAPVPVEGALWEMPDLVRLPVAGTTEQRWAFTLSVQPPEGSLGSGVVWWPGSFDGYRFDADAPAMPIDHGADFYAQQTWAHQPDERRIWVAWMGNWAYASETPTQGWRGQLSIPRQLELVPDPDRLRLVQRPLAEMAGLFAAPMAPAPDGTWHVPGGAAWIRVADPSDHCEIQLRWDFGVTLVRLDRSTATLTLDRRGSGLDPGSDFAAVHTAPLRPDAPLTADVYIDHSSVEVLADGGRSCISDLIFPVGSELTIEVTSGASSTNTLVHPISDRPGR